MRSIHRFVSVFVLTALALAALAWCVGCDRPVSDGAAPPPVQSVSATGTTPVSTAPTGSPPAITFASMTHDFGRILETEIQTAELEFANTGGSTLIIEDIKTSCGCTAVTLVKRQYEPGERGAIKVEFDPAGPGDDQRKYVKVITNADPDKPTQVAITADVDPFVIIEPRKLEFGVLPYGQGHTTNLTVTSIDPDFTIEAVRTTNPNVVARLVGTVEPADGESNRKDGVELTVSPDASWGPLFSWLEMDVRGVPRPGAAPITYEAKMRVQGQIFGELRAKPDTFRFGAAPDETFERSVRLTRADGAPFTVLAADVTANRLDDAQVRIEQAGPGEYDLILSGSASSMATINGVVMVTSDIDGEQRIDIPIVGVIRQPARVR